MEAIPFLSPPVHIAQWAHMRHFASVHTSVCLDFTNLTRQKKRTRFENTRIPTSHMPEFLLWHVHGQVTRLSEVNGTSH